MSVVVEFLLYRTSRLQRYFFVTISVVALLLQLETALKEFFQLREMEVPSSEERCVQTLPPRPGGFKCCVGVGVAMAGWGRMLQVRMPTQAVLHERNLFPVVMSVRIQVVSSK